MSTPSKPTKLETLAEDWYRKRADYAPDVNLANNGNVLLLAAFAEQIVREAAKTVVPHCPECGGSEWPSRCHDRMEERVLAHFGLEEPNRER